MSKHNSYERLKDIYSTILYCARLLLLLLLLRCAINRMRLIYLTQLLFKIRTGAEREQAYINK